MKWIRCVLMVMLYLSIYINASAEIKTFSPTKAEYYKNSRYTFFDSVLRDIEVFKYGQPLALILPVQVASSQDIISANLVANYNSRKFQNKTIYISFKTSSAESEDGRNIYNLNKTQSIKWDVNAVDGVKVQPSLDLSTAIKTVMNNVGSSELSLLVLLCPTPDCETKVNDRKEIELEELQLVINTENSSNDGSGGDPSGEPIPQLNIIQQPQSTVSATEGDSMSLSVTVEGGNAPYNYKWVKDGSLYKESTSHSTSDTLVVESLSYNENGSWFQCQIDDGVSYLDCDYTQIQVQTASPSGQAYLTWEAPQTRSDGSYFGIDEIDHYNIRYWKQGTSDYKNILIYDALKTDYVFENLSQGTWNFMISVKDKDGLESDYSNSVNKTF